MGLDEVQAQGDLLFQHGRERKKEIAKLWVTWMSDCYNPKKLVESMSRRLAEAIENEVATTGFYSSMN